MQIIKTVVSLIILSTSILTQAYASELRLSSNPNRSASVLLEGSSLSGNAYIYAQSTQYSTKQVRFYLDTSTNSSPTKIENIIPYDLGGTESNGDAIRFNTATISDGSHTLTAELENNVGSIEVIQSQFFVTNNEPRLTISESLLTTSAVEGAPLVTLGTTISTNDGSFTPFTFTESTPWLEIATSSTNTPANVDVLLDTSTLTPGEYQSVVSFSAAGILSAELTVRLVVLPVNTGGYQLLFSSVDDRSSPSTLNGASLSGNTHIFVSPENNIKQVQFYLDKPISSSATKIENVRPFDLGGTKLNSNAIPLDTSTIIDGPHTLIAKVVLNDSSEEVVTTNFEVFNSTNGFLLSPSSISESLTTTASPVIVNVLLGLNASADGSSPPYNAISTENWLSVSPATANAPETLSVSLDSSGLTNGTHAAEIQILSPGFETAILPVTLLVSDFSHTLQVNNQNLNITSQPNEGIVSRTINLTTSDNSIHSYSVNSDSPWLTSNSPSGSTPEDITINIDTNSLQVGNFQGTLTISANTFDPVLVTVNVTISNTDKCAPVTCADIKVSLPYELNFDTDNGHIKDKNNAGTGFTYIQPTTNGTGLIASNIETNTEQSLLSLTTTKGIQYQNNNGLDNAIGVGFAGTNQITDISTTLISPPVGTGNYEQAGLWFGTDEDNLVKLVLMSTPTGTLVELSYESAGVESSKKVVKISDVSSSDISFRLIASPANKMVTGFYSVNGGEENKVHEVVVSPELFSFDAAGIDPEIGTRSFTGIFATHRHATNTLTYNFDNFTVKESASSPAEPSITFTKKSHSLSFPSSMVWAPNGKLYVASLFGTIHELTYDNDLNVVSDVPINTLTNTHGSRLTLGITYHQDSSSPNDFSLWLSHSSPSVDNGVANSGMITRLSGPNFEVVNDIITGLPRAKANHAPNSLHFGPDDRLYISIGGNTGAGAPVNVPTEFGDREEQPLSAAIVVADVFSPSFDGSCANNADIYGPVPCDVRTYSTGLRNAYDFVFHSNGSIYSADNGLGVTGAFPSQPYPDCSGLASPALWTEGGQNPGEQPDILLRIIEGKFYGHPNPSINECVFKDGSYQGVAPSLNYEPPLTEIGSHTSSNGMIEYKSDKSCGQLKGNLLISNYSLGNNILRVVLDETGERVLSKMNLVDGFDDPLTISENTNGDLFVAEFGSGKLTSLRHESIGCWSMIASAPEPVLDSGSTSDHTTLYMVGGKTSNGAINSLYSYDTVTDAWSTLTPKPGIAVENPAAVFFDGYLYVFGGSSLPFSGGISDSYRYHIASNTWETITAMPTPRGGIRAEQIAGKIYVVGGMDNTGQSLSIVEVYDPVANNWTTVTSMSQKRDNPGTAVVNQRLYVFGGRERTSAGIEINGTKNTAEVYDPVSGIWSPIASMPTGRRTMVVGTLNNKIQVIGGEKNLSDPDYIFRSNEQYDPITDTWVSLPNAPNPRHGAAYSTINNKLFISGGGYKAGSSFTTDSEVYTY